MRPLSLSAGRVEAADGRDSSNLLPALLGENVRLPVRGQLMVQANCGRRLAIPQGWWKLIPTSAKAATCRASTRNWCANWQRFEPSAIPGPIDISGHIMFRYAFQR